MKPIRNKLLLTALTATLAFASPMNAVAASDSLDIGNLYPYSTVITRYNPDDKMAHNFYLDPNLSETTGKFSGYSIDFKADCDPVKTYWSLCNWQMSGGADAYAGFQNTVDGKKAIISFWENNGINAQRIYPDFYSNPFGGEGEGTNSLVDYNWQAGHWYKMVLRCYDSFATGNTIVEQWVLDKESGVWTLLSAFDTKLQNSYMIGPMSCFLENYNGTGCEDIRSIQLKNIYVQEYGQTDWKAVTKAQLATDTCYGNKKGGFVFGATDEYFYGITCGCGEDIVDLYPYIATEGYYAIHNTEAAPTVNLTSSQCTTDTYYICSRLDTEYALTISDSNLKLGKKNSSTAYRIRVQETPDGYYTLTNVATGKVLEANAYTSSAYGTGDHKKIYQKTLDYNDYQKWSIVATGDGYYFLINKATGLYLDVQDAWAHDGNNVNLFVRNGLYSAQDWAFVPIS